MVNHVLQYKDQYKVELYLGFFATSGVLRIRDHRTINEHTGCRQHWQRRHGLIHPRTQRPCSQAPTRSAKFTQKVDVLALPRAPLSVPSPARQNQASLWCRDLGGIGISLLPQSNWGNIRSCRVVQQKAQCGDWCTRLPTSG